MTQEIATVAPLPRNDKEAGSHCADFFRIHMETKRRGHDPALRIACAAQFGQKDPPRCEILLQRSEWRPTVYRVYSEGVILHSWAKRSTPVRDFDTNEAVEAADVSGILQGFRCEQLGQKIHRRIK